jgi:hypothetical protein
MEQNAQNAVRWLMIEGLMPLCGAGVLYLTWGLARFVAANPKAGFTFVWKEALDPFGWLYGGGILAVQSLVRSLSRQGLPASATFLGLPVVATALGIEGFACMMLLIAAMNERGQNAAWKPPATVTAVAAFLVVAILIEGYVVYSGL